MTVTSTGHDAVDFSIFLGDKVYPFSSRRTNSKKYIVKRESGCPFHSNRFDKRQGGGGMLKIAQGR